MRWEDFRQSDNVEDVRGSSGGGGGPMGGGMPGGAGGLGIGAVVILGILGYALGIDPRVLISGMEMIQGGSPAQYREAPAPRTQTGQSSDENLKFVRAVLGDTEDRWKEIFERSGRKYPPPRLVLFSGSYNDTKTNNCGLAQAAMGPFYCPLNNTVYLDTAFFRDLEQRFRGCEVGSRACRFAQAYVIAHEVGHHVQNVLQILPKVQQIQRGLSRAEANRLQVKVELQADCYAGIWAYHSNQKWRTIDQSDINAALRTAAAIGDDRLQKQSTGRVVPESFTHGTSEDRMRWFNTGFKSGSIAACNTFKNVGA